MTHLANRPTLPLILRWGIPLAGVMLMGLCAVLMLARRAEASAGWVAYITDDYHIGVVRVDGHQRLTLRPPVESPASPLWLSGHEILFSAGVNRAYSLYTIQFPSGQLRQVIEPPAGVIPLNLRRLPAGEWVYFSGFRDSPRSIELYRADLATGQVQKLTDFAAMQGGMADFDISPDGTRLAVVVSFQRPQVPNFTYVMQADGTQQQRIGGDWIIEAVRWAENGNRLIVTVYDSNGPRLFRMTPDGGEMRVFRFIPQAVTHYMISADGQRILYHVICGYARYACIYQVQTDGQSIEQLTPPDKARLMPIWSPDERWVGYLETGFRKSYVWRMKADGSDQRLLATNSSSNGPLAWSPPIDQAWGWGWLVGGVVVGLGLAGLANRLK